MKSLEKFVVAHSQVYIVSSFSFYSKWGGDMHVVRTGSELGFFHLFDHLASGISAAVGLLADEWVRSSGQIYL